MSSRPWWTAVGTAAAATLVLVGCTSPETTAPSPPAQSDSPGTPGGPESTPPDAPESESPSSPVDAPDDEESPDASAVIPTLTYVGAGRTAGTYEFSGHVPDLVMDGGTCVFHLRSGSTAIDKGQEGIADAAVTSCGTVVVGQDELSPGAWTVTLEFTGGGRRGTSAQARWEVP